MPDPANQVDDWMRPYLPPAKAINLCSAGLVGTLLESPAVLTMNILYLRFGDHWLDVFMPNGIPIGPVIIASLFAVASVTYVRKIYLFKTATWVRRFRRIALISSGCAVCLAAFNVIQLVRAPNQDCFAAYVLFTIFMSVILCQAGLLIWTIHKYRWYDPNSRPEEWELPDFTAGQKK